MFKETDAPSPDMAVIVFTNYTYLAEYAAAVSGKGYTLYFSKKVAEWFESDPEKLSEEAKIGLRFLKEQFSTPKGTPKEVVDSLGQTYEKCVGGLKAEKPRHKQRYKMFGQPYTDRILVLSYDDKVKLLAREGPSYDFERATFSIGPQTINAKVSFRLTPLELKAFLSLVNWTRIVQTESDIFLA